MATVIGNGQLKQNDGSIVTPQQGGWYDGQQFWGGSLSNPGQINSQSNQQGAGQQVSNEVIAQTNPANVAYVQQQQQQRQQADGGSAVSPAVGSGGSTGGGGIGGGIAADPNTPNLPDLYSSLYASKGITDLEKQLSDQQAGYNKETSTINDNPWLSEASRTGRIAKLTTDYNNNSAGVRSDIATRKADIETQIGIQTKQFDINSQAASAALQKFNTLLSLGALDNASPDDIASITRSTGLSSGAIQSAIKAGQEKNSPTSVIQFDDGTNQGFEIINPKTGEVISKQVVAASKPTKATKGSSSDTNNLKPADYISYLQQDASSKSKYSLASLVQNYQKYVPIDKIYQIYNQVSPNGKAKETLAQVKAGAYNYK